MTNRLGLTALLVGAFVSPGCGGGEELNPVLEDGYVFAQFQEDQYCGPGENFNRERGNIYEFVTVRNLVVHTPMNSSNCGNSEIVKPDFLYINQFLGPVSCEDFARPDDDGMLILEGLYNPDSNQLWASKVLQLDPEIKKLWPLDVD